MKIAVDVMGGDHAPNAILDGCRVFLNDASYSDADLILFGDSGVLEQFVSDNPSFSARVKTVATTEVIGFDETPTAAYKKKKDSSLVRAFECVKNGDADCLISAGSTGAWYPIPWGTASYPIRRS